MSIVAEQSPISATAAALVKHFDCHFWATVCIQETDQKMRSEEDCERELMTTSSTTFTQCARKATEFGEITQNKGNYAVQGHSKSPILVPIESSYISD